MYVKPIEQGEEVITLTMVIEPKDFMALHASAIETGYLNPRTSDYEQKWEAIQAEYIAMRQKAFQFAINRVLERSE